MTTDSGRNRSLHLGYMYWSNGTHPAGWRLPEAVHDRGFDGRYVAELAQLAERGKFDFFFFGDRLATGPEYQYTNTSVLSRIEPFTAAGYLATLTSRIGIVVTANPTYYEPFNLARLTASLDHISAGRASWNIVTGADGRAADNYTRTEHGDATARYDRADEFVDLVRRLWDSWEDDAFLRNPETGEFVDATKIHTVGHEGRTFRVRGPLNVARPPQGHPVILHAGTSDRSRDLGARDADVLFAAAATIEQGKQYSDDIRRRTAAFGRDPAEIAVLPGLTPIVARTRAQARELYDRLNALIALDDDIRYGGQDPAAWSLDTPPPPREAQGRGLRNLGALSQRVGVDLTGTRPGDPLDAATAAALNPAGRALLAAAEARTGRSVGGAPPVTVLDLLYTHVVGGHIVVGDPTDVADYIQAWFDAGASDGFNIQSAYLTEQLEIFVELVIPELQRRGLFRHDYTGRTLREHLGLARPANHWAHADTTSGGR
ncbi:NtaA/DmoA family FMN-dependent monooxygenase [Nocardia sp. alder85J]|uniref:NtaA/DmoA family FMN-dependent monooxygenase n=1 Tax=Nocardia sp. alder85J TaxID=2862949 RepID=UPI001CD3B68F|nr:NtaA/DmoA family FMN-dependent monooxygenase [Nocardia sp. alder85J]MCX4098210.1 NtaA/DmoA family FMN-dependent monooxygenase [Nocardia sp. alder85J]